MDDESENESKAELKIRRQLMIGWSSRLSGIGISIKSDTATDAYEAEEDDPLLSSATVITVSVREVAKLSTRKE